MRRTTKRTQRESNPSGPSLAVAEDAAGVNGGNEAQSASAHGKVKEDEPPFWEYLASLGDRWGTDGLKLYIWRVWPKIDKGEPNHYICTTREPVDEEYMLVTFGSGRYMLILKDSRAKQIRKHVFSIHNERFPPRVDAAQVLSVPENDVYFKVWAKKNGGTRSEENGTGDSGSEAAIKELAGLVRLSFGDKRKDEADSVTKTLINWALRQKEQERAENSPTAIAGLVKELKGILPTQPATAAVDPLAIVDKVLAIQNRSETDIDKIWKLAEKAQAKARPELSANPLGTVKETLDVFEQLRDLFKPDAPAAPAAVSGDLSGWQAITSTLVQTLPAAMTGFAAVVQAFKSGAPIPLSTSAEPVPPVVPRPGGFDPYRDQAAVREFVRQQNAAPAAASQPVAAQPQPASASFYGSASGAQAPANPVEPETNQAGIEQQQIVGLISSALSCLQRGVSGRDFADGIIITSGELAYSGIVNQIRAATIPTVITLAKTLPGGIGEQVAAYEVQFTQFIAEFLQGPPDLDEEEDDAKHSKAVDGAADDHRPLSGRN